MAKKIISNKEQVILLLLLIFRFVNSKQIQRFLGHKDHRRINSWLKDLVEKGYVERDFKPIFGTLTKPAVYYLTAKGRAHLKQSYAYHFPKYLQRIARDAKASKSFRIRCQLIADWYLAIPPGSLTGNKSKTGIDIVDRFVTELTTGDAEEGKIIPKKKIQFFTPAFFPSFILLEKIKPDAYLRRKGTKGILHGLLFVIDAYVPRFLLRYTLKHIFDTLDEENWSDESTHSLHVYLLCPNNQIIIYLRRLIPNYMEQYYGKELVFHLETRNELSKKLRDPNYSIKRIDIASTDY